MIFSAINFWSFFSVMTSSWSGGFGCWSANCYKYLYLRSPSIEVSPNANVKASTRRVSTRRVSTRMAYSKGFYSNGFYSLLLASIRFYSLINKGFLLRSSRQSHSHFMPVILSDQYLLFASSSFETHEALLISWNNDFRSHFRSSSVLN